MEQYYSDERNVQIVVALMKAHGIKRVVVSPGSTNVTIVGCLQYDSYFEIYSCVDERSAAYMACGLAAESGEPVALSCTGATASRNYFPALTEAYYRKLPILAITSTQDASKIGNYIPQVIDRSRQPNDTCKLSQHLQTVKDKDDEWDVTIKANRAMLELFHHGAGPVHINLTTTYSRNFIVKELPYARVIYRHSVLDGLPELPKCKIAIYVGSHLRWPDLLVEAVDAFCERHYAVVFTDPTANYRGKYGVCYEYPAQQQVKDMNLSVDLLIHIGEMSDLAGIMHPSNVWRVSEDGELRDFYRTLNRVFEMPEEFFFRYYASQPCAGTDANYLVKCRKREMELFDKLPELPFSHLWIAQQLSPKMPENSSLHLGILSPLRSWGYFPMSPSIECYCNQGGFGIDGNISSMVGASLVCKDKLYFLIVGDLSFFYDLNSMGNRHIGNNVRILLVNNGLGAEFKLFKQLNSTFLKDDNNISARGHFGQKSPLLVRHYAEDLGYEYMAASNKEEFDEVYQHFITPEQTDKPIIFECFTDVEDENEALYRIFYTEETLSTHIKSGIKNIMGEKSVRYVKELLRKK